MGYFYNIETCQYWMIHVKGQDRTNVIRGGEGEYFSVKMNNCT